MLEYLKNVGPWYHLFERYLTRLTFFPMLFSLHQNGINPKLQERVNVRFILRG